MSASKDVPASSSVSPSLEAPPAPLTMPTDEMVDAAFEAHLAEWKKVPRPDASRQSDEEVRALMAFPIRVALQAALRVQPLYLAHAGREAPVAWRDDPKVDSAREAVNVAEGGWKVASAGTQLAHDRMLTLDTALDALCDAVFALARAGSSAPQGLTRAQLLRIIEDHAPDMIKSHGRLGQCERCNSLADAILAARAGSGTPTEGKP